MLATCIASFYKIINHHNSYIFIINIIQLDKTFLAPH